MIQDLLTSEQWLDVRSWREQQANQLSAVQVNVLPVTNALTRFLERKYALRLDVYLHDQYVDNVSQVEADLLQVEKHTRCLRRKVSLMSRKEVMFDAESVLPLDVLPTALMAELEAGKQPLANLLSDRGLSLSRSNLSISHIQGEGFYHHCWARRSVLVSESGVKALVTEVFQEAMWRKLHYLLQR